MYLNQKQFCKPKRKGIELLLHMHTQMYTGELPDHKLQIFMYYLWLTVIDNHLYYLYMILSFILN